MRYRNIPAVFVNECPEGHHFALVIHEYLKKMYQLDLSFISYNKGVFKVFGAAEKKAFIEKGPVSVPV